MNRPRLWPAALIGVALLLWLAFTWLSPDTMRQYRTMRTGAGVVLATILLLLWLLFLSRLRWKHRLAGLAAVLLLVGGARSLVRIRGVSGDLIPILEPRWTRQAAPDSVPEPVPSTGPGAALETEPVLPAAASSNAGRPAQPPSPTAATPLPRRAGDFPQFLGPRRDGTVTGVRLARDWSAEAPRKVWRQRVGEGWSGFAAVGDALVTQEQRGAEERVVAYEIGTGRVRWTHADPARFDTVIGGIGPRATPTVADGRVFTMGATGIVNALDLASGRRLWTHQAVEENGARPPQWGKASSPLVVGHRVVVSAGGPEGRSLVAYEAATGEPAWRAGDDPSSYSSPVLMELAGKPQIVILNRGSLTAHDPETGAVLWRHPWPPDQDSVMTLARLSSHRLLASAGYGVGSKLYEVQAADDGEMKASLVWESPRLKSKFANVVLHGGYVYGLDDGVMTCLDPATGERKWKGGRYGHGQILLAEDLLLVQTEEGEIVLLEPSPDAPRELARFAALEGKTWNPPALAGTLLAVRNDREAAVYELPAAR
jgi:outer membrane protein assembly factor BamB